MKKILLTLLLPLFVFVSCAKDNDESIDPAPDPDPNGNGQVETKNPYKTDKDLSSSTFVAWENKGINDDYFMLGYGYDVTGKYAHPTSVRNKVVNIEAFDKDYNNINFFQAISSGPELSIGRTPKECIEAMGSKAGFKSNEISKYKNLFKEKFTSAFGNDTSFPDLSYQYLGISQVLVRYSLSFHYMSYMQERFQTKYLTDEFKADLETKPAEEILKLYGTHILKDIKIGERIDYLYRYAEDKNQNSYNWFLSNMHRYFSIGPSAWGSQPKGDPPLKENLYIEVVDGTRPNPNAWMVDITNYKGERVLFDGWNSITDANLTLVNFRSENCLIPIYDLVKDTAKKETLVKAYEKYLSE